MDAMNRVEISDKDGWRKEFPLSKSLLYVGSGPDVDVRLDPNRGGGVMPRHLQLVTLPGTGNCYLAINLEVAEISVAGNRKLPPHGAVELADGDFIRLGDFVLTFRLTKAAEAYPRPLPAAAQGTASRAQVAGDDSAPAPVVSSQAESVSNIIGLTLAFRQTDLETDHPIDGSVIVRNQGTRPGVQFRLELEGLPPDRYTIGPGPILFPNGEKEVYVRLMHPLAPTPEAGECNIKIRASAPDAYPGESTTLTQVIRIQPFYSHTLRLLPEGITRGGRAR